MPPDSPMKKLLGWVQGALREVESAIDGAEPPAAPPAPQPAPSAPRAGAPTGKLQAPKSTGGLAMPGLSGLQTAPLRSLEEQADESKQRLKLIMAFMKDPQSHPLFEDKPKLYRILTEERSYQMNTIVALVEEHKALPPPAEAMGLSPEQAAADPSYDGVEERRADLEARIEKARTRQKQIFQLLKHVTGVKGKSGGTGWLPPLPGNPPPPPAAPPQASQPRSRSSWEA